MTNFAALQASDGSGEAIRATVQSPGRSIGSSVIPVNAITNWPTGACIVTTGTLQADNTIASPQVFYATASGTSVTITSFAPGYTDLGNSAGDVVVIKPTTEWANLVATAVNSFATTGVPTGALTPFAGASAPTGWLLCQGQAVSRSTYASLFTAISTAFGAGDGSTTFNLPDMRARSAIGSGTGQFVLLFASTAVNTSTSQITVLSNNSLFTGTPVVLTNSGGTVPTGLTAGITYYVMRASATLIWLASSLADAIQGNNITLTGQGSGTNTLTQTLSTNSLAAQGGEEQHALVVAEIPSHNHSVPTGLLQKPQGTGGLNAASIDPTSSGFTGGSTAHNVRNPFLALNYIIKT